MWCLVFTCLVVCAATTASASCPVEISPDEVVVPFGGSFSVTCRAGSDQVRGMGWESPFGGTGVKEGVANVTLHVESLRGWRVNTICFANLRNGTQCSKILPVTAYKMADNVTIRSEYGAKPMEEDFIYSFYCQVMKVAPARKVTVQWFKGNQSLDLMTEPGVRNHDPVDVTFRKNLQLRGEDDGAQVRCEATLDLGPSGPRLPAVSSEPVQLIVLYPPTFHQDDEKLSLPVGGNMTLNCRARGNPAPRYNWTLPAPLKMRTENQAILTLSFQHPGTYQCTAANSQGAAVKRFTVSQAPRDRTTFTTLVVVFVAVGVLLAIGGLLSLTPHGMFSCKKDSYTSGVPTSGPV